MARPLILLRDLLLVMVLAPTGSSICSPISSSTGSPTGPSTAASTGVLRLRSFYQLLGNVMSEEAGRTRASGYADRLAFFNS